MRAAAEPHFRRGAAIDLNGCAGGRPQLEPVKPFAEDREVAECARAGLILVGERLGREAAA